MIMSMSPFKIDYRCRSVRQLFTIQSYSAADPGRLTKFLSYPADSLRGYSSDFSRMFGGDFLTLSFSKAKGGFSQHLIKLIDPFQGIVLYAGVIIGLGLLVPWVPDQGFICLPIPEIIAIHRNEIRGIGMLFKVFFIIDA